MSRPRITHSYEYNAMCDSCKFVYKASELRLRWDGFMVCKDDWEPRHPSDFYRPRNDVHKLPFTRSDAADTGLTWLASVSALTVTSAAHETYATPYGDYTINTTSGKTQGNIIFYQMTDSVSSLPLMSPRSTTTSGGGSFTLPTTPTTGGNCVWRSSYEYLGQTTITAGSANVLSPVWTAKPGSVFMSFTYGT